MATNRKYYEILGKLNGRTPEDYDKRQEFMAAIMSVRRLERKSQRLNEYECNGEGYFGGKFYRLDGSTPGAYVSEDVSVFDAALDKVQAKIRAIAEPVGLAVEFQGDPRGYTVRVSYNGADISQVIFE